MDKTEVENSTYCVLMCTHFTFHLYCTHVTEELLSLGGSIIW